MATEIDPVCGMTVDTTTSQLSLEHDGKTYWFCSRGCLLEFSEDPDKYLVTDRRTVEPEPRDKSQLSSPLRHWVIGDPGPGTPRRGRSPRTGRLRAGWRCLVRQAVARSVAVVSFAVVLIGGGLKW